MASSSSRVGCTERADGVMQAATIPAPLREKLGEPGTAGLRDLLESAGREWKADVLATATDSFERRLTDECSKMRVEMANGLANIRVEIIKWSFAFWVSQIVTLGGLLALLMRTTGTP